MDQPYHMDQSFGEYLHQNRSTPASSVSENQLENQNSTESKIDAASRVHTPSSISIPPLSTTVSSESGGSPFVVDLPRHHITQSRSEQTIGDQSWTCLNSSRVVDSPVPFLEEPRESASAQILAPTITRESPPADMTTLGVQFDPQFDAVARASYTWPLFDMNMNEQFLNQDVSSLDHFNISASVSPYAKSLTSSPPPALFSPEQRELKRQRDLARRDSKTQKRRERAMSNPYLSSQHPTPDLLPRVLANNFSSTMAQQSMTAQSSPTFSNTVFMPQLGSLSSSESSDLYGASFPVMPNDFGLNPYLMPPYSSTVEQSIPSYTSRPHSLSSASDQPYFYRSSPVSAQESQETVRVVHSRPKPQCWDHGCNGRQFSTFSNLLRHQREKSGVSSKPSCPKCGAEFTRTTARNGHMAHEKCKQRRNSNQ